MIRAIFIAAVLAVPMFATPAQAAPRCVIHGREIRNREHVSCTHARAIAARFFSTFADPPGWSCQGYRGMVWRGYCETNSGRSYFSWRLL